MDYLNHPFASWQWSDGNEFLDCFVQELQRKGHGIEVMAYDGNFGRGQIIWKGPETGVFAGGTESRTDGAIAAW